MGTGVRPWTGLRAHPSPADTGPNAFLPPSPTSPLLADLRSAGPRPANETAGKKSYPFKRSPRSPRDRRPLPLKRDRTSPVFTLGRRSFRRDKSFVYIFVTLPYGRYIAAGFPSLRSPKRCRLLLSITHEWYFHANSQTL